MTFYNDKNKADGKRGHCKTCCKKITKQYKLNNPNKVKKYSTEYFRNSKKVINVKRQLRVLNNPEKYKKRTKEYDSKNRDKRRLRDKQRWQNDRTQGKQSTPQCATWDELMVHMKQIYDSLAVKP